MRAPNWFITLLCCIPLALAIGCQDSTTAPESAADEHGHEHEHPESLADALVELDDLHAVISKAFNDKKPDDAHDPLHDVGHVLEEIVELAKTENVPADRIATIETSVKALFEGYGELDKTMHGGEGKTWEEVSGAIDEALKNLKAAANGDVAPAPTEEPAAPAPADEKPADEKPAEEKTAEPAESKDTPADAPKSE
ncbi:MAG: hypothetical protein RL215_953 [Planctomycetota bacterium]|jgi:hypothetical protein